jgi:hypothetical protein
MESAFNKEVSSMFGKLPCEREYYIEPEVVIKVPGSHVPTVIQGSGHITFSFARTKQHDVLAVGLKKMHLRLAPFMLPIATEEVGIAQCVEVSNQVVDESAMDLEASQGTLNLETGAFEMAVEYVFTSKQIPQLKNLGDQTLKFSMVERGKMDLRTGLYTLHAGVVEIEEGPLAGTLIRNHGDPPPNMPPPPEPFLNLTGSYVAGIHDCRDILDEDKLKTLMICPCDEVILCWEASDYIEEFVLEPTGERFGRDQVTLIRHPEPPVGGGDQAMMYVLKDALDPELESSVKIQFYDGGWLGPYHAVKDGATRHAELTRRNLGPQITVHEIQLLETENCCGYHRWELEKWSPGYGAREAVVVIEGFDPIPVEPQFPALGEWQFEPIPGGADGDDQRPVCFLIRGECRPR